MCSLVFRVARFLARRCHPGVLAFRCLWRLSGVVDAFRSLVGWSRCLGGILGAVMMMQFFGVGWCEVEGVGWSGVEWSEVEWN